MKSDQLRREPRRKYGSTQDLARRLEFMLRKISNTMEECSICRHPVFLPVFPWSVGRNRDPGHRGVFGAVPPSPKNRLNSVDLAVRLPVKVEFIESAEKAGKPFTQAA